MSAEVDFEHLTALLDYLEEHGWTESSVVEWCRLNSIPREDIDVHFCQVSDLLPSGLP